MSHLIRRLRAEGHPLMKEAADELEKPTTALAEANDARIALIAEVERRRGELSKALDALMSKPPREGIYPWAVPLEKTKHHADYWLQGGANKCDNHEAIVCMTQASYSWMNCAYHYAEKAYNLESQLAALQGGAAKAVGYVIPWVVDTAKDPNTIYTQCVIWPEPHEGATIPLYTTPQPAIAGKVPPELSGAIEQLIHAATTPDETGFVCTSEVERFAYEVRGLLAPAPIAEQVDYTPPFDNCRYEMCDLPGQCRDEGKCHHPKASAERG